MINDPVKVYITTDQQLARTNKDNLVEHGTTHRNNDGSPYFEVMYIGNCVSMHVHYDASSIEFLTQLIETAQSMLRKRIS